MLQRGYSGDLASTLCKYDLRKGDIFVLSWERVRRVRRGNISSELLIQLEIIFHILLKRPTNQLITRAVISLYYNECEVLT